MSTATPTRDIAALTEAIITHTHRVPKLHSDLGDWPGDSLTLVAQLDAVLATIGFTLSGELALHLATQDPAEVRPTAVYLLATVRTMVGDHVPHNTFFIDFPRNVPESRSFLYDCLLDALRGKSVEAIDTMWASKINLLNLPAYGRYPHDYTQMLAAHDDLIASVKDRLTVLHLGGDLISEAHDLYASLVARTVPLAPADLALVAEWAAFCPTPTEVPPVRETRAVINAGRLRSGYPMMAIDTVTDVLRVACAVSDGDPTLETPTRFRSFTRRERRALLGALDGVVRLQSNKLADIAQYREPWKRLGERLHPLEYLEYPHAAEAFSVARGERIVRSLASRVQHAFDTSDRIAALQLLDQSPGMLLRNVDRLLRCLDTDDLLLPLVISSVRQAVGAASGRVLLGLREHLNNRIIPGQHRVFANRNSRAWVTEDTRPALDGTIVNRLVSILDDELHRRLPHIKHLVCDPATYSVALPLTSKTTTAGFGVLPRGSMMPVTGNRLRFFTYWRQAQQRTDYDLSALFLDSGFNHLGHVSYTSLSWLGTVHSGDIVTAPFGASEFIDVPLDVLAKRLPHAAYIIPQVNVYDGEGFDDVAESLFGFMTRDGEQEGRPFEPRTVRMRSEMRGAGRVALPLTFQRIGQCWYGCWTHLYLTGDPYFNRVEGNARSTATVIAGMVNRRRMTLGKWLTMQASKTENVYQMDPDGAVRDAIGRPAVLPDEPVTYVGLEAPEGLPAGSDVITVNRFHELVVA
jgi:hypothetical protein